MAKKTSFLKKVIWIIIVIVITSTASSIYVGYRMVYKPNIFLENKTEEFLYIKTGASFTDVVETLQKQGLIRNKTSFEWLAEIKKYKNNVKPGKYKLKNRMSNNELIDLLRSGKQEPIKLVFTVARTKTDFAQKISNQIEADSATLLNLISSNEYMSKFGLNADNSLTLFIPNTYQFYWNTSAEEFIAKMATEYKKFWTDERKNKASLMGLTQTQIVILASIVQQESNDRKERPIIAGVYLNRLNKGMRLQADPTVIFALGNFTIRRVLKEHLQFDSKYNTYLYSGLPPGPICMVSGNSIDAVLNHAKHKYIYFCAKEDFSGCHNFAASLAEHENNARKYRQALNKRSILK